MHDAVETCAWPPAAHTRYHVEFGRSRSNSMGAGRRPKTFGDTDARQQTKDKKNIHSTVKGDFVEHCPTLIFFWILVVILLAILI